MVLVDDDVAGRQVGERRERGATLVLGPAQGSTPRAEDLALSEDDDAEGGDREPRRALADDDRERLGSLERRRDLGFDLVLAEDLAQVLRLALVRGGQPDAKSFRAPAGDLRGELVEAAGEARDFLRLQDDLSPGGGAGRGAGGAGDQAQLDDLAAREALAERRVGHRFVGRLVQKLRQVDQDRRRGGKVVEEPRGGLRGGVLRRQRQDEQLVELPDRALGRGIEQADRLDIVAEELEPRRTGLARREDVDDPAAQAPLPHGHDRLDLLVAASLQRFEQKLAVQAVARGEPERARREFLATPQGRAERGRRRDHGDQVAHREPARDHRPLGVRFAVMAATPEPRLRRRELEHGRAEELQVLRPAVSVGEAADYDERGARMSLDQLGDGQRAGRAGEAGDAQADFSLSEGLRQRFECRPLSQHSEPSTIRYHGLCGGLAGAGGGVG